MKTKDWLVNNLASVAVKPWIAQNHPNTTVCMHTECKLVYRHKAYHLIGYASIYTKGEVSYIKYDATFDDMWGFPVEDLKEEPVTWEQQAFEEVA